MAGLQQAVVSRHFGFSSCDAIPAGTTLRSRGPFVEVVIDLSMLRAGSKRLDESETDASLLCRVLRGLQNSGDPTPSYQSRVEAVYAESTQKTHNAVLGCRMLALVEPVVAMYVDKVVRTVHDECMRAAEAAPDWIVAGPYRVPKSSHMSPDHYSNHLHRQLLFAGDPLDPLWPPELAGYGPCMPLAVKAPGGGGGVLVGWAVPLAAVPWLVGHSTVGVFAIVESPPGSPVFSTVPADELLAVQDLDGVRSSIDRFGEAACADGVACCSVGGGSLSAGLAGMAVYLAPLRVWFARGDGNECRGTVVAAQDSEHVVVDVGMEGVVEVVTTSCILDSRPWLLCHGLGSQGKLSLCWYSFCS